MWHGQRVAVLVELRLRQLEQAVTNSWLLLLTNSEKVSPHAICAIVNGSSAFTTTGENCASDRTHSATKSISWSRPSCP